MVYGFKRNCTNRTPTQASFKRTKSLWETDGTIQSNDGKKNRAKKSEFLVLAYFLEFIFFFSLAVMLILIAGNLPDYYPTNSDLFWWLMTLSIFCFYFGVNFINKAMELVL